MILVTIQMKIIKSKNVKFKIVKYVQIKTKEKHVQLAQIILTFIIKNVIKAHALKEQYMINLKQLKINAYNVKKIVRNVLILNKIAQNVKIISFYFKTNVQKNKILKKDISLMNKHNKQKNVMIAVNHAHNYPPHVINVRMANIYFKINVF